MLRDVEKETHKHIVLWELVKTRGRKSLCTLNRVGVSVKMINVNFLLKRGGHGRGAIIIITITTITSKVLVPLASGSLFVSRLAQGCRKGDPQT